MKLSEIDSLCSDIMMKIQTSSSIPDEVSSIKTIVSSDKDKYFRGSIPSSFSFMMTPSVFISDSDEWETDQKGYHISQLTNPVEGSQIDYSE